ncbi:MAG: hypothetical protein ACREI6_06525 [Candidatus Rokuibacteriota bacterium]
MLILATVLDAARPETLTVPLMAGVWAATGLVMAALLSQPGPLRQVWGRAAVTTGLHALALPVAAAISFVVAGAQWSPSNPGALELSATVLGVRLAATPLAIRVGVGGFVLGLLLLSIGDRALRGLHRPRVVGGR